MNCSLKMVEEINYNTKMFIFKLPGASHMIVPTGQHIKIKGKTPEGNNYIVLLGISYNNSCCDCF